MITKCLSCGKIFDVEPSWKGQTATCDSCGKDFTVKKYIECPQCSQLTPEDEEKCKSCNAFIKLKRPAQFIPSKQNTQSASQETFESDSPLSCSEKHSQIINYDADKKALESVSGLMRFWMRLAAVLMLFGVLQNALEYFFNVIRKEELTKEYIVAYSVGTFVASFIVIMGAKMMSDSARTNAKIVYTKFHKIIAVAFIIIGLLGMLVIGNSLLAGTEQMGIQTAKLVYVLIEVYTFFVAWQLYKARALAQAETITD
jgi:hypothetical protein